MRTLLVFGALLAFPALLPAQVSFRSGPSSVTYMNEAGEGTNGNMYLHSGYCFEIVNRFTCYAGCFVKFTPEGGGDPVYFWVDAGSEITVCIPTDLEEGGYDVEITDCDGGFVDCGYFKGIPP